MKKYILIFSAVFLLMPFLVLAQDVAVTDSGITTEDLEISDPGLLPTSNFYFFKEFARGLRRAVTFNATRRAELELKITNEKAAELKKVSENTTDDTAGLDKAIANYKANADRLKLRFEALKETSENPNIDKLLDKLADKTLKHQQLFEELKAKHETVREKIEKAQERLDETAADAAERLDKAEKLKERFQKAVENQRGKGDKEIKAIRVLDKIEKRVKNSEGKMKISETKDNLIKKSDMKVRSKNKEKTIRAMKPAPTNNTAMPVVKNWNVEIKNGRFAPSELKIRKGDMVIWTNRNSSPTRPASGPHPTHTIYPGFDALKMLSNGENYSFTFDKIGSWKYHDHLNPSVKGV